MKQLRYGVIGMGMGSQRARQIKREEAAGMPVKLISVCDLIEERVAHVGKELEVPYTTDMNRLFEDPQIDAIYVVTETGNHAHVAIEAMKAGKHVLSTKPMEASLQAAVEEYKTSQREGVKLAVDFDKRYNYAQAQRLKYMVDNGLFGRILFADSMLKTLRTDAYFKHLSGWRGTWALDGGGAMSNQGVHEYDLLYYLLGIPDKVYANIFTQNHDIEAEDLGVAIWTYNNGCVVNFRATTSWPIDDWYASHEISGTEGLAQLRISDEGYLERYGRHGKWIDLPSIPVDIRSASIRFACHVLEGDGIPCDGLEAVKSLSILKAMYRSAQIGSAISPRDMLREAGISEDEINRK